MPLCSRVQLGAVPQHPLSQPHLPHPVPIEIITG